MRVILVEDHDDTRRGLAALLRITGHFVTDVAGADDALAVLAGSSGRYDCVMVDLSLPPGDSDRILTAARQARVSHCIALGGSPGELADEAGSAASAGSPYAAWLSKPVKVEDLNRLLRQLGGGAGRRSDGEAPPPAPPAAGGV